MTSVEYLMSKKITPVIKVVGESNQSEVFVTITIEQFEEYGKHCADKAYGDGYTDALRDRPRRNIDTVVEYCEKQLPCDCVIGFEGDIPVTHKLCDNCKSKIWESVCPINSSIIIEKCVYRGEKCSVCIK